jgi:Spy/CpxP family protein refolding chaperone
VGVISRRLTDEYAEKMAELEKEKRKQLDEWQESYRNEMKGLVDQMKKERESFKEQYESLLENKMSLYHSRCVKLVLLIALLLGLLQVGLFFYGR